MARKRQFKFEAFEGLCDVYVEGHKVFDCHNARRGQIYLHLDQDYPAEKVTIEPHDPRVPIQADIVDGEPVPKEEEKPKRPPTLSELRNG